MLDRQSVGSIRIVWIALAIFEIRMGADVEQIVRSEFGDLTAIRGEVAEIEMRKPGRIHVDVCAAKLVSGAENLMEGVAEHAAGTCSVNPLAAIHQLSSPSRW